MSHRKLFFVSLMIAAILSAPVAAAAVVFQASRLDPVTWSDSLSPAMWSARSFLMYFDLLVPVALVPCAVWMSRLRAPHPKRNRPR
jgi:hypothetical protein